MEKKNSYIISLGLPMVSTFAIIYAINTNDDFLLYLMISALITGLLAIFVGNVKKRNLAESFALGYLFSLIGVVLVAILPSPIDISNKKNCPFCKELINIEATKCPFCQSVLNDKEQG